MRKLLIGGAALALAVPALAQIAPAVRSPAPAKAHTRAEVQARVAQHFARLDTNRDGYLTQAEADAARQALKARLAERRAERGERAFERLDANRDGAISRAEWDAAQTQRQQRMAARDRNGDGRPDPRGFRRGGMAGMHGMTGRLFGMADADRDGRVTLAEAQAAALRHFDMVDANRDGRITPDERRQMRERMRAGHQHG